MQMLNTDSYLEWAFFFDFLGFKCSSSFLCLWDRKFEWEGDNAWNLEDTNIKIFWK